MRTSDMIKSKFWRAADVQGKPPFVLTISGVTEELVQKDVRCFLWFMENNKGLRINKTIVRVLEAAYGPDSDAWTGRRVRISFDPSVEFGGRAVGGVKLETPPGAVYAPQAGAAPVWGEVPPQAPYAPPGAPPPPVWDGTQWVFKPSPGLPPAPPSFDTSTGEVLGSPPQTISQRVAAQDADFNDPIPF